MSPPVPNELGLQKQRTVALCLAAAYSFLYASRKLSRLEVETLSPSTPPRKRSPQLPPGRTLEDAAKAADIPPPTGLAATVLEAGSEEYAVLSFPLRPVWTAPGLTPAERAVIEALLTGVSAAQIAVERGTSVRTVRNQIRSAYVKLGVSSRGALARLYASMVK